MSSSVSGEIWCFNSDNLPWPKHWGWACGSFWLCHHGSGSPAFGVVILPSAGDFRNWIWHHCHAQGRRSSESFLAKAGMKSLKTVPQGRWCKSDLFQNNICEGRGETRNHTTCKPMQAITILYIGGASATSSLLSCQEFDGNRDASAIFWHTLMFLVLGFDVWPLGFFFCVSCSRPFCRLELESTFFRCRDVTCEFPIPGTPSAQLHLSQSDAIHPLHRVVEIEIWGGFHWPCLCVWVCRCHSKLYPLPLFETAGSIAFQQNDDSSSYISAGWSKGVLAWNPKFYHRDKMAAGRGFV